MFLWFGLLLKSLLKKYSYLLILLMVPVLVYAMNLVSEKESGVLKIILYQEEETDEVSTQIVKELLEKKSIIQFVKESDEERARKLVLSGKADALWIFDRDMTEKLNGEWKETKEKALVHVVELEDTALLQLAREKLYGTMYPLISYASYKDYIVSNLVETGKITCDEAYLKEMYDENNVEDTLFEFSFPGDETGVIDFSKINYLLTPLRGLLIMIVVLSSFAAQLYYLNDKQKGIFVWLPASSKYLVTFGYQFAAMLPICVVVYLALYLSGLFTKAAIEIVALLLLTVMTALFTNILRRLSRSIKILSVMIPVMIMLMVALSQIFMEINQLRMVQYFLPTYYYMNVIHNIKLVTNMLLYCILAFAVDGATYLLIEKRGK